MNRILLPLCLFGILLLSSCSSSSDVAVYDRTGKTVGYIVVKDTSHATYVSIQHDEIAWIRGNVIRDMNRVRMGTIENDDTQTRILHNDGGEVGFLENGRDCMNENGDAIGHISKLVSDDIAGGACLVFFVF